MPEREGAPEPEHDALRESIDHATDELSELLKDPATNADAITAKKKDLAELSAQLPPHSMEAVAQGLVEEGGHIVKEDEAAAILEMKEQLNAILASVEKGEQPTPAVEHTSELTEADKKLRSERLSALTGEARMFVETFQTVLGELHGLDEGFRKDVQNRLQGIADTALGRLSLSLELEGGVPTGMFRAHMEEVTPDMVDGFVKDVQGGTTLLEGLRRNIAQQKQR